MTTARSSQIDVSATPYYHCVARCVRRAFLCGQDTVTGRNFDHRKRWVVDRLAILTAHFAIDICAYAVMSNHIHLVLHIDTKRAASWTDDEVITRVAALFPSAASEIKSKMPKARDERIATWRERLSSISWFMRCISETIARMANKEDQCKGRFWEGRFRSQLRGHPNLHSTT